MRPHWMRLRRDDRGAALLEMAFTLPLLLLISMGVIEFGRAFQTWQVLTNAAREGARVAVLPGISDSMVTARVQQYVQAGILGGAAPTVTINRSTTVSYGTGSATGSKVTVSYPFHFMVLNPVAKLVVGSSATLGTDFTMAASATMRNEN